MRCSMVWPSPALAPLCQSHCNTARLLPGLGPGGGDGGAGDGDGGDGGDGLAGDPSEVRPGLLSVLSTRHDRNMNIIHHYNTSLHPVIFTDQL